MKVEIKEIKKERQDGFYKVKYRDRQEVARYYNSNWFVVGISSDILPDCIKVLDETPISFDKETEPEFEPFEPFELSLTIESEKELLDLENRLFNSSRNIWPLWKKLNEILNRK